MNIVECQPLSVEMHQDASNPQWRAGFEAFDYIRHSIWQQKHDELRLPDYSRGKLLRTTHADGFGTIDVAEVLHFPGDQVAYEIEPVAIILNRA